METHALSSLHPPSLKIPPDSVLPWGGSAIRRYPFIVRYFFLLLFLFPFPEKFGAVAGGDIMHRILLLPPANGPVITVRTGIRFSGGRDSNIAAAKRSAICIRASQSVS